MSVDKTDAIDSTGFDKTAALGPIEILEGIFFVPVGGYRCQLEHPLARLGIFWPDDRADFDLVHLGQEFKRYHMINPEVRFLMVDRDELMAD